MHSDSVCFADQATQHRVPVVFNNQIAENTFRLRFECPEIAQSATPGQFLMLRLANWDDPLIGRPLAMYETEVDRHGHPTFVDVVYVVGGKLTSRLCKFTAGQEIDVWGPLGNGFPVQETDHLIMVAGGIGQTPFLALAKEHRCSKVYGLSQRVERPVPRISLCYGARSASLLAGLDDFEAAGAELQISTDDGSAGHHGLVTDLVERLLDEEPSNENVRIVCCGPEKMMEAVSNIAIQRKVPAQVSLETPMACGIGICFTCVARVRDEAGVADYRRTCVEGPVFDADRIEWD